MHLQTTFLPESKILAVLAKSFHISYQSWKIGYQYGITQNQKNLVHHSDELGFPVFTKKIFKMIWIDILILELHGFGLIKSNPFSLDLDWIWIYIFKWIWTWIWI